MSRQLFPCRGLSVVFEVIIFLLAVSEDSFTKVTKDVFVSLGEDKLWRFGYDLGIVQVHIVIYC